MMSPSNLLPCLLAECMQSTIPRTNVHTLLQLLPSLISSLFGSMSCSLDFGLLALTFLSAYEGAGACDTLCTLLCDSGFRKQPSCRAHLFHAHTRRAGA